MSYEGEELYLCANGHHFQRGCYDELEGNCPVCAAPIVWRMGVDQTNNAGIWPVFEIYEKAKVETCSCCNHTKVIAPETYKIPMNQGHFTRKGESGDGDFRASVPSSLAKYKVYPIYEEGEKVFDTIEEAVQFLNDEEDKQIKEREQYLR